MAYRFTLASVLRVRALAAEQEELVLARILGELERLRGALAHTERELLEASRVREQIFSAQALQAMHLHASYAAAQELRTRSGLLRKQIADFEKLRIQQVARYEDAYRRRELLVCLRDEHRDAWLVAQTRNDEKAANDAFLARQFREAHGSDTH